jgi:tight adherence protein C
VIAAVLAALAAGIGGAALLELLATRSRRRPRGRGHGGGGPRRRAAALRALGIVGRLVAGAARGSAVAGVPASLGGPRHVERGLDARLAAAGVATSGAELAAIRTGAALVALAAVLPLAWAAPGRLGLGLAVLAPAAAHAAPSPWLWRRTRRRAAAVDAELADVLDLLRVALAAGLAPMRALAEVGRRHPGVLAEELRRAAGRRALGLPAATVLDELEERCPGEGVPALCAALRRADRHGAPLNAALLAQARASRAGAAARTAEAAARASPRIQLVVALLLVPSVLLLVAAGLLPALTGR